ncbi:hypothetical protein BP5796_10873 [Coleophoma crateriformis]|uniref:Pali-domain-containing protein n=1 Tax=Coleophoma crateriformis TaxID=565419 RepID=A0A3D8QLI4_9HELO|nr:hypothetical protein BP5796_10873 [Coleophoma crateriformis]
MAKTGIFHHVGTFLLFAAAILLLITTISAPVITDIGILKVTLTNQSDLRNSSINFGTFGYCTLDVAPASSDQDYCSGKHIGYNPALIMAEADGTAFGSMSGDSTKALTRVMVLHPVGCGLAFIAFLFALGAGVFGALLASLVSALAFIITVVVMAVDFTIFGIIKNKVNKDGTGSRAYYSIGMWTTVAAMICLFLATFIVFFTCFSARMHKRRNTHSTKAVDAGYPGGYTTTKRHFWQRRARTNY